MYHLSLHYKLNVKKFKSVTVNELLKTYASDLTSSFVLFVSPSFFFLSFLDFDGFLSRRLRRKPETVGRKKEEGWIKINEHCTTINYHLIITHINKIVIIIKTNSNINYLFSGRVKRSNECKDQPPPSKDVFACLFFVFSV